MSWCEGVMVLCQRRGRGAEGMNADAKRPKRASERRLGLLRM